MGSDLEPVDLVCGGFPCVNISTARAGGQTDLDGPQSGLWSEQRRILGALRPRWCLVENIAFRWAAWVPKVRADLAALGYASLPLELSAGSFGAPHRRPRVFVVADSHSEGESLLAIHAEVARLRPVPVGGGHWRLPPSGGFRVADGLPGSMDRLRMTGNAVVPPVAEWLGRRILAAHLEP